jgi:hypothetical protein
MCADLAGDAANGGPQGAERTASRHQTSRLGEDLLKNLAFAGVSTVGLFAAAGPARSAA